MRSLRIGGGGITVKVSKGGLFLFSLDPERCQSRGALLTLRNTLTGASSVHMLSGFIIAIFLLAYAPEPTIHLGRAIYCASQQCGKTLWMEALRAIS